VAALGLANDSALVGDIQASNKLRLISGAHHVDPSLFRQVAERIWNSLAASQMADALAALIDSMTFLDAFRSDYSQLALAATHYDWFLNFLVLLPDMEELADHPEWDLSQLMMRFGKKPVQWLTQSLEKRLELAAAQPQGTEFKLVPLGRTLLQYVKPIDSSDASSSAVTAAVESLVTYSSRSDTLGYVLPEYAVAVDPTGCTVPNIVVGRLQQLTNAIKEEIWRWSRFAGHYALNSEPWRKIATAAIAASEGLSSRDRISIYVSLLEQGFRSSSFAAGEMDPQFADELQRRREERANETDARLIPFRDWALRAAQSDYERTLAEFREESDDE
jgi:hypothetical protein